MKKNNFNKQSGVALLFTVILLAIILSISLALAAIFLPKLKVSADVKNSAAAFFAADSAGELCLYEARRKVAIQPSPLVLTNGAIFTIASPSSTGADIIKLSTDPSNLVNGDCVSFGSGSFRFRARGALRGVNRAIEASQ